jgi:hypothetical protein
MLAKIENGVPVQWPLGEYFIRATYPNTSFPEQISDETLLEFGFARFQYQSPPQHDSEFQEAKEITPVLNGAVATQAWEIVEKYSAEEKAAYIVKRDADALEAKKASVRAERNDKLAATDWRFRSDMNPSQAWIDYCQALRDVTAQAGFPWDIEWPVKPE